MDKIVFDFLKDLTDNNNREWFHANKERYNAAKIQFENFIDELIPGLREIDPLIDTISAKDCTFRIYRDVRFSTDKSPYKTNMGAYIARGGKSSMQAGYYVHVEAGASMLAGGLYMPPAETLKKVRDEIYYKADDFKAIILNKKFMEVFGMIDDPEKLKNPPKGFPKEFPDIGLLKYRNYAVMHKVPDHIALQKDYPGYALGVFRQLYPLNAWFNNILL
jgi:uncharacterized protein (TIGR02453 family)